MRETRLTIASVTSAVLASLCCIGPLVAAALGVGTFAAAGAFESLRPYLLVSAVVLLGVAFYLTYRPQRAEDCSGPVCPPRSPGRHARLALWIATALVMVFASFPYYSSALWKLAGARARFASGANSAPGLQLSSLTLRVDGMTCAGCAAAVESSIVNLDGVKEVSVSFEQKAATVRFDASRVTPAQLVAAVEGAGYRAQIESSRRP